MMLAATVWDVFKKAEPEWAPPRPEDAYLCVCGGGRVLNEDGLPTCTECGRCEGTYISDEPEWRDGPDESGVATTQSRVGAPANLDHFSSGWNMGTIMKVANTASSDTKRLSRISFHLTMNHRDRSLFYAYADMDRVGRDVLNLPGNVMYAAKIKYKQFSESVLTRGAIRVGVKANCIFQACKEFGVARTTQEIANAFDIPVRDVSRTTDIFLDQQPETQVTVTTPADLVARLFNSVTGIPEAERGRVRMKIISTCKSLEDCPGLQGRTPKAVACAVMWTVLKDRGVARADLCRICEVSVPTLTKLASIVAKDLEQLDAK